MPAFRFHESLQRGSPDFPLEYYLLNQQHSRYEMSFHWHEEIELLRVISGVFTLSMDETTYSLAPGDVAFIPSGCLHGGVPENAVYECVVFDMRFLLKTGDACRRFVGDVLHRRIAVTLYFQPEARRPRPFLPCLTPSGKSESAASPSPWAAFCGWWEKSSVCICIRMPPARRIAGGYCN